MAATTLSAALLPALAVAARRAAQPLAFPTATATCNSRQLLSPVCLYKGVAVLKQPVAVQNCCNLNPLPGCLDVICTQTFSSVKKSSTQRKYRLTCICAAADDSVSTTDSCGVHNRSLNCAGGEFDSQCCSLAGWWYVAKTLNVCLLARNELLFPCSGTTTK